MVLALCILVILVISIFLPDSINRAKQAVIKNSDQSEDEEDDVFDRNNEKRKLKKKLRT